MITKKTALNKIEITASGVIQARIDKQLVEGGSVIDSKWHRTAFAPGQEVARQVAAVNTHLAGMGYPEIPAVDEDRIKAHADLAWTPEIVAAYRAATAE